MAKKSEAVDPTVIPTLLDDIKALYEPGRKVVVDIVAFLGGKSPKMQSVKPVKCGPKGETDTCVCLDCAIQCTTQALVALVQAKHCQEQQEEDEDSEDNEPSSDE